MENSFAADYLHPFAPENFPLHCMDMLGPNGHYRPRSTPIPEAKKKGTWFLCTAAQSLFVTQMKSWWWRWGRWRCGSVRNGGRSTLETSISRWGFEQDSSRSGRESGSGLGFGFWTWVWVRVWVPIFFLPSESCLSRSESLVEGLSWGVWIVWALGLL